jgi:flavin-binding protein dodecin
MPAQPKPILESRSVYTESNVNKGEITMSVVKVIEVICEGKSIEDAMNIGVKEASKTIKNIKQVDVKWIHANVEHDKIVNFRINAKISFVIEH